MDLNLDLIIIVSWLGRWPDSVDLADDAGGNFFIDSPTRCMQVAIDFPSLAGTIGPTGRT
jgi:hypothetical protein